MALTTGEFLKRVGLEAFLKGGDVSESLDALKQEMASNLAAQKPAGPAPKKRARKEEPEEAEPVEVETTGEEVQDATDFGRKYGRGR